MVRKIELNGCTMRRCKSQKEKDAEAQRKAENERITQQKLKLINLITEWLIIYDKGHHQHLNTDSKMVVWEQISEELGESGKFIKYIVSHVFLNLFICIV